LYISLWHYIIPAKLNIFDQGESQVAHMAGAVADHENVLPLNWLFRYWKDSQRLDSLHAARTKQHWLNLQSKKYTSLGLHA